MYITSDVMILNATVEWAKWEENLLLSEEKWEPDPARHFRRYCQV